MVDLLPDDTDLLGGLELGGVPIATMVSSLTGQPALFVRKQAKAYGTCKLAEGPDVAGRRVTLIEDVITTGGAVRDATNALREAGRSSRSSCARSTAARRARTRSPTSGSRSGRCSPRPSWTPLGAAASPEVVCVGTVESTSAAGSGRTGRPIGSCRWQVSRCGAAAMMPGAA